MMSPTATQFQKALITKTQSSMIEPTYYSSAIKRLKWRQAMKSEFDVLLHNLTVHGHWSHPSEACNVITSKWMF